MKKMLTAVVLMLAMFNTTSSVGNGLAPSDSGQILPEAETSAPQLDIVQHADLQYPEAGYTAELREDIDQVNGFDMSWTEEETLVNAGPPDSISEDELLPGIYEYEYEHATVGFYDGVVEYIVVQPSKDKPLLTLGEYVIPLKAELIRAALGEPDYEAEDGDVYIKGATALKVFKDPENGKITSVEAFWVYGE
ncbi:hypothetical protein DNH61_15140 [Paenibacillus sambharensis]|uniref:Copper amine oxidase-like N-terminal domain-containing protein n=1 Tax=Paenibacillus sambharensis TaxID=1803190 RepID=A0A2W1LJ83_9BACL|nr:hypothetical protein [Paenibacillus sambharensis]PZD94975.1 hypothetical protein DNH61_15140 [Paenibacillus sambharensis]